MDFNVAHAPNSDIKVKLLLVGGHEYTLYLKTDSPLLRQLLQSLAILTQRELSQPSALLQIPVEEGHGTLYFPSHHLVGLVTEPPLTFQQAVQQTVASLQQTVSSPQPSDIIPSKYVQLNHFLTPDENRKLLSYVLERESEFVSTTTSTGDADYRKSKVLHAFPEFSSFMISRIKAVIPQVIRELGIPPFVISDIEAQLTAHNDGNYYRVHNDNGSSQVANRELTYVYYFYQEPKPFTGGDLLIYDSQIRNNFYVKAESYKRVEPQNNSIVFFLSRYLHEVLAVSCPSQAFGDSRFTINGWVRRQVG